MMTDETYTFTVKLEHMTGDQVRKIKELAIKMGYIPPEPLQTDIAEATEAFIYLAVKKLDHDYKATEVGSLKKFRSIIYKNLKAFGFTPEKALQIAIDIERGDSYALNVYKAIKLIKGIKDDM